MYIGRDVDPLIEELRAVRLDQYKILSYVSKEPAGVTTRAERGKNMFERIKVVSEAVLVPSDECPQNMLSPAEICAKCAKVLEEIGDAKPKEAYIVAVLQPWLDSLSCSDPEFAGICGRTTSIMILIRMQIIVAPSHQLFCFKFRIYYF